MGEEPNYTTRKKAWPSINHSILSALRCCTDELTVWRKMYKYMHFLVSSITNSKKQI
jgi:hypothetical protein